MNEDFEGFAFVVFEKNGQLYEVHASHCSCYGLEGQWKPEETNFDYLKTWANNNMSFLNNYYSNGELYELLNLVLKNYEHKHAS